MKTLVRKYLMHLLAIICLALGLLDATRLLGVGTGDVSPLSQLGATGFILLAVFTIFRLFSSVGMWIGAGWGAPLIVGVTIIELVLWVFKSSNLPISVLGLFIRLILLVGIGVYFFLQYQDAREDFND